MPQYQGMWSMQKVAQLQAQQQWADDPQFNNTILLLQADNAVGGAQNNTFLDSSANAFTVTRAGNTTQGTFTPFSQSPGWWSTYISGGASGGLTVTDNVALRPNTNSFTLEFWINFSSLTGYQSVFSKGGTSANQLLIRTETGTGTLLVVVSGTTIITASSSSSVGVWDHYALVRSGTTWTLYRNGTSVGTATNSTSISTTANIGIGSSSVFNSTTGYISNFRLTIGAALYTSSFTPSPTPLTTTSQGAVDTQVELLTCQSNRAVDNSINNFTVSLATNVSIQPFSPFAPQYQYTQDVIGGSAYFDGTGDYLSVADSAGLNPETDEFVMEAWVYITALTGNNQGINGKGTAGTNGYSFYVTNGLVLSFIWNGTGGATITAGTLSLNTWNHVAVVRNSGVIRLYLNGVGAGSSTPCTTNITSTGIKYIGQARGGNPILGYMSNYRMIKGSRPAGYDATASSLPVPAAPLIAITNTQLLLNYTNAGIIDGAMKNDFETVNQAQISTSVVKYGTGSIAFDGNNDYIVAPYSPLFNLGTGQFTIEGWVNFTTLSGNRMIFDTYTAASAGGGYQLYWRGTGSSITFYGNGVVIAQSSFNTHATGVWYHIAVTRDASNVVRIFIDGTQYASATYATALDMATTGTVAVGIQRISLTNDLDGYVDDLRVTKGFARYTANFTPPQTALQRQ